MIQIPTTLKVKKSDYKKKKKSQLNLQKEFKLNKENLIKNQWIFEFQKQLGLQC
jgi:hypothetical protein